MNKIICVGLILCALSAKASFANEYDALAVCDFNHKYASSETLSHYLTTGEWLDILDGKGQKHEEFFTYQARDLKITYSFKEGKQPLIWETEWLENRIPREVSTKPEVMKLFKVKGDVHSNDLRLGCDCGELDFSFENEKSKGLSINFGACD